MSSPPFHITAALLHRLLDDPAVPLRRADLVVGWCRRAGTHGVFGPAPRSCPWRSRYEFLLIRRLAAETFSPVPSDGAALISIRRRSPAEA